MSPNHPTKRRRSSSPGTSPTGSLRSQARPPSSASPSHPFLPAPIPSGHVAGPSFPPYAAASPAGPSNWQSHWPHQPNLHLHAKRRSMDARSPSAVSTSPRMMEGIDEGSEGGTSMVFSREGQSRAPRSMMACTRCRRQKMKCDGPSQVPCRGCRQSGQPCIFEARSRPKSISALPSRPPPFFAGALQSHRPGSPAPGFYPSLAQPAPPITSRQPPLGAESYAMRQAREPMPPPPPTSLSVLASASSYPPQRGQSPPRPPSASVLLGPTYQPPPLQLAPFGSGAGPPPPSSSTEARLRNLEMGLQALSSMPRSIAHLQGLMLNLQRSQDSLASTVSSNFAGRGGQPFRAREAVVDVPEPIWENYRSRAWPLTPWLVGLREALGLPGLVVSFLAKRTLVDRTDATRRECEEAAEGCKQEVGRLIADGIEWRREEIRSLGIFATWTNDPTLAALAISHARLLGLDRISRPRSTHDDWREWIYLAIMDQMHVRLYAIHHIADRDRLQIPDFSPCMTQDILSPGWRERLDASPSAEPAVRDRDIKLLAWLEYAESLCEVRRLQQQTRATIDGSDPTMSESALSPAAQVDTVMEPWRTWANKWEAWAGSYAARNDPILSLHFNYAILLTASPVFLANGAIWPDLAQSINGYQQLERARDAAFAVIQAICSPEIGRTLPYSFALYRPQLGFAIHHLVALTACLASSPIISQSHVMAILRSTHEIMINAQPLDLRSTPARPISARPGSTGGGVVFTDLLTEMVETGRIVEVGKRELVDVEPGREVWRRLLG